MAKRWTKLCPPKDLTGKPAKLSQEELRALIAKPGWVKERRKRLASMSWLMKLIKEKLARQANREDKVTGHFWEGRFKSVPLLDGAAVIAGMVYVDINPIRAGIAATPEESDYTSVQERIFLQMERSGAAKRSSSAEAGDNADDDAGNKLPRKLRRAELQKQSAAQAAQLRAMRAETLRKKAEKTIKPWVVAMKHCAPGADGECSLSLADYLQLVDLTARKVREGKRGSMNIAMEGILQRLGLDSEKWIEAMGHGGRFRGRAVGSAESRQQHLAQRQATARTAGQPDHIEKWIADKTPLYADPPDGDKIAA